MPSVFKETHGSHININSKDSISHSNKDVKHLYTNKGDEGARVRAERMEQDGASPEEIWTATGWARDLSGQWVTEIDDSSAVYSGQGDTLGESLNHTELYGSHPELGGYGYGRVDMPSGNANFDASNKQINVNTNNSPEQQRGSTFHETQHALQDAEGRAGGSSVEYWARWLHDQKYLTRYRIDDLNDMLSGREEFDEELDAHPIVQEYKANATQPSLGYDRGLKDARRSAAETSLSEYQNKLAELEKLDAMELYRNTAGEIEARDAASRIDMTAEERRNNFPEAFKQRDGVVFAVDNGNNMQYNTDKWHTNLSSTEMKNLNRIIKYDIRRSKNKVTDGANWLFTRVGNRSVFAIYSTDDFENPTLLYASDNAKGIEERNILLNIAEGIKNGKSFNGQSRFTDRLLNGDWLQYGNNSRNSFRALGRNGNVGNASVLQGKPSTYGSAALRNVLRNLFEIQFERERDGVRENGGVKNDHSSFVHGESGSNTHPLGFRRFGRGAEDTQIDGEYYRLIERLENIDPEADIMEQVDSLLDVSNMVKHRAEALGYEVKNGKAYKDGSVVKSASSVTYDDDGNVIPLSQRFDASNPDIRYSRKDVTDADTENGENMSQLFTNTMHKGHYDPEFTMEADSRVSDFTYNPISNKETYESAQAHIEAVGEEKALRELYSRESWSADDTAVSLALIERFNQNKDYSSAVDVFENMRKHATKAGQAIQAISIVNRLTPEGQYMAMQRMADKRKNATIEKIERGLDNKGKAQFRKELAEARAKDRAEAEAKRQQRRTQNAEELLNRIRLAAGVTTDEKTGETRRGFKKKTEATKAKMSRDEAGKQLLELLRNARTGKQQTENNSYIKKSRKNAENTFSKDDITLLEMWLKNGDVYNALYYVQDMDLSNLTLEDDSFVDNYMARLEEALSQPAADIFNEDDRNRLYETLRSGDINKVQEILDGFELDLVTESDEQFLAEFADEFAARLKRKDKGVSKAKKPVKPLGKTIYSPTTEELTAKPDAVITEIKSNEYVKGPERIENLTETFKNVREYVRKLPWFDKPITNGDAEFAAQYGELSGRITVSTLGKGRSYRTPYMPRQLQIMQHLDEIFKNGKVIKVHEDSTDDKNIDKFYTLLSPVRFEDGSIGVVKLNVRKYIDKNTQNKIHENKILEIKELDASTSTTAVHDGNLNAASSSTMSIAEMLEFVKGEDYDLL